MKVWKDRFGNKLTAKEFMQRWKAGIDGITPAQQTQTQINFTRITLLGIFLGLVFSFFSFKNLWWLSIILFGAFGNTYVQLIALKQKRKMLKGFENLDKEVQKNELE